MPTGLLLSAAIVAEVVGTIALRDSHGFSRPLPSLVVVARLCPLLLAARPGPARPPGGLRVRRLERRGHGAHRGRRDPRLRRALLRREVRLPRALWPAWSASTWPGGRTERTARGERRRRALLDATLRLVARDGPQAATHRAVAAEAGVPLAATTYYFASRDDLVASALRQAVDDELAELADQLGELGEPATAAEAADLLAELFEGTLAGDRLALLASTTLPGRRPHPRAALGGAALDRRLPRRARPDARAPRRRRPARRRGARRRDARRPAGPARQRGALLARRAARTPAAPAHRALRPDRLRRPAPAQRARRAPGRRRRPGTGPAADGQAQPPAAPGTQDEPRAAARGVRPRARTLPRPRCLASTLALATARPRQRTVTPRTARRPRLSRRRAGVTRHARRGAPGVVRTGPRTPAAPGAGAASVVPGRAGASGVGRAPGTGRRVASSRGPRGRARPGARRRAVRSTGARGRRRRGRAARRCPRRFPGRSCSRSARRRSPGARPSARRRAARPRAVGPTARRRRRPRGASARPRRPRRAPSG